MSLDRWLLTSVYLVLQLWLAFFLSGRRASRRLLNFVSEFCFIEQFFASCPGSARFKEANEGNPIHQSEWRAIVKLCRVLHQTRRAKTERLHFCPHKNYSCQVSHEEAATILVFRVRPHSRALRWMPKIPEANPRQNPRQIRVHR